ncbi:MAG: class I SAM-dependent methyltransferase, partial [Aquincola tertiaricarbonis]
MSPDDLSGAPAPRSDPAQQGGAPSSEADGIAQRYARRTGADRYSPLQPDVACTLHERQRAMLALWRAAGWQELASRRIVEVGSGAGGNLLELLRLGATPEQLTGIELLPDRHAQAQRLLPAAVTLLQGDATQADLAPASVDMVLASTVFSSLLQPATRQALAAAMWRWLRPGGAVLWYDFTVDNPRNADVRGVTLHEVQALFP